MSNFNIVTPSQLSSFINQDDTLILDIRPHAAHSDARIPHALSLSVPSTLLKRPLFSLQRLAAMLPSSAARARFSTYRDYSRILVYDADASSIPESSNIYGLLRKFKNDDYHGQLAWLRGGFQAVLREHRELIDTTRLEPDDEDSDDRPVLRTHNLPVAAFSLSSTIAKLSRPKNTNMSMSIPNPTSLPDPNPAFNPFFDTVRQNVELSQGITERIPLRLPRRVRRRITELPFTWLQAIAKRADRTLHTHHPHYRHASLRHLTSSPSTCSDSDSSDSDTAPSAALVEEGTEALAMQFYRIELAEQRRLMSVMEHHSKESGCPPSESNTHATFDFPFSITAGVEKGAKNRYRHIWPFEHARVRLHHPLTNNTEVDDYINASYVQPLSTNRRYIATQGPLEATFTDFWTLCWEQNVHVIVMLTKEIEGSMVKCGAYWPDVGAACERTFGHLKLTLVGKVGLPGTLDLMQEDSGRVDAVTTQEVGFGFPVVTDVQDNNQNPSHKQGRTDQHKRITTIKRIFDVTNSSYPLAGTRRVIHLQYLEWPDMNVPDDTRGVLGLIREVDQAVEETGGDEGVNMAQAETTRKWEGVSKGGRVGVRIDLRTGVIRHSLAKEGNETRSRPVLLHCSAGVGRTGGFIAIDAVLDGMRREIRQNRQKARVTQSCKTEAKSAGDAVDDAQISGTMMTDPIPVSGEMGNNAGTAGNNGLVMHMPAVAAPTSQFPTGLPTIPVTVDEFQTPMQVDDPEEGKAGGEDSEAEKPAALTRKWAESVRDPSSSPPSSLSPIISAAASNMPYRHHFPEVHPYMHPPPPSSTSISSGSAWIFPSVSSISDSDDGKSMARMGGHGSSSLGTSVSGVSTGDGASEEAGEKRRHLLSTSGAGVVAQQQMMEKQRFRTFSAPQAQARLKSIFANGSGSGDGTLGSSPLARPGFDENKKQLKGAMDVSTSSSLPPSGSASVAFPIYGYGSLSDLPPSHPPSLPQSSSLSHNYAPDMPLTFRQTTVDYKEPRVLHVGDTAAPVALSIYNEPIWEVIQDMREQRMSLCQSLRQYVFVHAAIIEGALMIVDDERRDSLSAQQQGKNMDIEARIKEECMDQEGVQSGSDSRKDYFSFHIAPAIPIIPPLQLHAPAQALGTAVVTTAGTSDGSLASSSSTGKRGASPTELLKEGKKGEVLLSKKPSIKRKLQIPDEVGERVGHTEP